MAYPALPDTAYLHPNPYHRPAFNTNSSGSSSSADPITPEFASRPISHQRRGSARSPGEQDIKCKWVTCRYCTNSPDELYDHLCNIHVGRKSTNNLCLTCSWEGCGVRCVKRDHITSHLRVHTSLKPHPCGVCGKTFKRPQDLKKHERIHTTEHHHLHRLSKAATSDEPSFTERLGGQERRRSGGNDVFRRSVSGSLSPSSSSGQTSMNPSSPYDQLAAPVGGHPVQKSGSPTPSALAALHRKQHEELAMYQQREMQVLQQVAYQQQQTQAYANHLPDTANAGSKRELDGDDLLAGFFEDVKKRRVNPVYDSDMFHRLNSLVPLSPPVGFSTLPSLPMSNDYPSPSPTARYPFYSMPGPLPFVTPHQALAPPISNPGIRTESDLSLFNQFMSSLGRDVADAPHAPLHHPVAHDQSYGGHGSASSDSSPRLSDLSPMEDMFNAEALAQSCLIGMPGIATSTFDPPDHNTGSTPTSFGLYPTLDNMHANQARGFNMDFDNVSKRTIAALPRPSASSVASTKPVYLSNIYGLGPTQYAETPSFTPNAGMGHTAMGPTEQHYAPFDSLARSKAYAPPPTLAPKQYYKKTYRHVAPLGAAVSSRSRESAERTEMDEPDEVEDQERDEETTPKISVRSLILSSELANPHLKLPAIHSEPEEQSSRTVLPSLTELAPTSTRPVSPSRQLPVKRHTDDEILRGVKRLELSEEPRPQTRDDRTRESGRAVRRRHAAMIRDWLVAVNLDWQRRQAEGRAKEIRCGEEADVEVEQRGEVRGEVEYGEVRSKAR